MLQRSTTATKRHLRCNEASTQPKAFRKEGREGGREEGGVVVEGHFQAVPGLSLLVGSAMKWRGVTISLRVRSEFRCHQRYHAHAAFRFLGRASIAAKSSGTDSAKYALFTPFRSVSLLSCDNKSYQCHRRECSKTRTISLSHSSFALPPSPMLSPCRASCSAGKLPPLLLLQRQQRPAVQPAQPAPPPPGEPGERTPASPPSASGAGTAAAAAAVSGLRRGSVRLQLGAAPAGVRSSGWVLGGSTTAATAVGGRACGVAMGTGRSLQKQGAALGASAVGDCKWGWRKGFEQLWPHGVTLVCLRGVRVE